MRLRCFLCCALLLRLASALFADTSSRRVAVLEFEPVGVAADLAVDAQHLVERELYGIPGIVLIERERIDVLLQEQELQLSDLTDQDTAVQVGRILAASTVVTGTVFNAQAPRVAVKVLDVETTAVLFVDEISLTRGGRAARRLGRGVERVLFPERYNPVTLEVGGGLFGGIPLSDLTELVGLGGGAYATAALDNVGINNLVLGVRAGLAYLPGSDANTQYLFHVPLTLSAGYRWNVYRELFLEPTLSGGIAIDVLSWDPDGHVEGVDEPEYRGETGVTLLAGAGVAVGYRLDRWTITGGGELNLLLETDSPKLLILLYAGICRRFDKSGG